MSSVASQQSGKPASESFLRSGTVDMLVVPVPPNTTISVIVADTAITNNSVVICWGNGLINATATVFSVDALVAGASFTINADNAPTVGTKNVGWAVLRY